MTTEIEPKPTGLTTGARVRFDYPFADEPNCNHPELAKRSGQVVTVEEMTDQWTDGPDDAPLVIEEWSIRFADGYLGYAHSDEFSEVT